MILGAYVIYLITDAILDISIFIILDMDLIILSLIKIGVVGDSLVTMTL